MEDNPRSCAYRKASAFMINSVLIPLCQQWTESKIRFEEFPMSPIIYLTVRETSQTTLMVEITLADLEQQFKESSREVNRWSALRIKPLTRSIDSDGEDDAIVCDMDYPYKYERIQTQNNLLAGIQYLADNI
jgi:hypothetical protein